MENRAGKLSNNNKKNVRSEAVLTSEDQVEEACTNINQRVRSELILDSTSLSENQAGDALCLNSSTPTVLNLMDEKIFDTRADHLSLSAESARATPNNEYHDMFMDEGIARRARHAHLWSQHKRHLERKAESTKPNTLPSAKKTESTSSSMK